MGTKNFNQTSLSLKWIPLAWLSLAFTFFVFIVFGSIQQGDPTKLIEKLFGNVALFAFVTYGIGLVIAVVVLFILLKRRYLGWQDVGFSCHLTRQAILYAIIGWFVSFWLYYLMDNVLGYIGIRMFWNESNFFGYDSIPGFIIIAIVAVIVSPIAEEIIYRGYMLPALLTKFKPAMAITLSGLIFASVHIGIGLGLAIYIFMGALILAYLYFKFENIYSCILMHILNNLVAFIFIPLLFGSR